MCPCHKVEVVIFRKLKGNWVAGLWKIRFCARLFGFNRSNVFGGINKW